MATMSARANTSISTDCNKRGRRFHDIPPSALIGGVAAVVIVDEVICGAA